MSPAAHPAAERNRQPILDVLESVLPEAAVVLEIASGAGVHAAHAAAAQPRWTWQPSEADPHALAGLQANMAGRPNVAPPIGLDVLGEPWPVLPARYDAVVCINMLHIAPWAACAALMRCAAAALAPGGALLVYGPFKVDGEALVPSNAAFDADLKRRNEAWGLRRLADVVAAANVAGLAFERRQEMPANNLMLAFRAPA